ncbi:MAG TPA: hypothetical protein VID50_10350 [Candidatus Eisenbacteria bacterium]|jgi:hypothetical protein
MSAVLLVRLKITDLTAWTALRTGRGLLPAGHDLLRVSREQLLLFEPGEDGRAASFEEGLLRAVTGSNFFVNPNKESYRFLRSSERGERWAPPEGAWGLLARSREETRDDGLRERLLREHPLRGLRAIRRARVWWLWTRGPDGGPGTAVCRELLGVTEGTRRGLLVNPHAEASILIEEGIAWTDVEAFLRGPAPAYRAAA